MINSVSIRPAVKEVEFVRAAPNKAKKRLIISLDGEAKTGKTHFCLTAPGSIAYHDLDLGLEGPLDQTLEQFPDKEIYTFSYAIPHSASLPGSPFNAMADEGRKVYDAFVRNYRASLTKTTSTVVDNMGDVWSLCRLANLGKLTQVLPVQYTAVNAQFRQLTQLALANPTCNVIYSHRMKAVYKNEQKTEEKERAGFGEIEYDVQAVVRTSRDLTKLGEEQFAVTIAECRFRPEATGTRFVGRDCTFSKIAQAIHPGTTEEDWR